MATDTILILGASGKSGRRVAARLRLRGVATRLASRSSPTPFDWSDPTGWDAALDGATAVYMVAPATVGPADEFVASAQSAGVRRVVLLSGRGADSWGDSTFGLDMRAAESAVRSSALEWTVLRPNNFAQNFDEDLFLAPLRSGELALPAGETPEPFIDLEDVADVAAEVLTRPSGHIGATYELTGPDALTFGTAVEMISRASGQFITYKQISAAEYTALLVEQGVDAQDAEHVTEMFVLMENGSLATTTDTVASVLGRPPRSFQDYVLRTAATGVWSR
ncbi:NAD(P)-dependent oxidoreductase [Mycobacterium adipatum]|uniref:NAD(P)-dependent oxidoreductase n=1 Tax=Mycobacterium adipatum TaxID=1682113 RepID=A0A172UUC1_9MYCO|nr:NAD(P)H-binding protein [Mycobacterium adipatum]ANE82608.1 NAD(P)-dependent oxidoreductase [Mycobacterium adipatum]MBI5734381.1 NAD(P)H-binding protein [Mycolicibacterium neoaurum]